VADRGDLLQVNRRAPGSIPVCSGPIEGDIYLTSDRSRINRAIETLFGLRGCLAQGKLDQQFQQGFRLRLPLDKLFQQSNEFFLTFLLEFPEEMFVCVGYAFSSCFL